MVLTYPKNRYVAGTTKVTCPRCGFDGLRSEMQKEPDTNSIVCSDCWDPHHPRLKPRIRLREKFLKIDVGGESNLTTDYFLLTEGGGVLLTEERDNIVWQ